MKKITIAHSPDSAAIFMYMTIKFGWKGDDFAYDNTTLDMQAVNEIALKNDIEATAISF
ncbi:S-ribosylhomocysteine lyase, partial [Salmonella enterica subsp. enterica serovar Schwarzengrund]